MTQNHSPSQSLSSRTTPSKYILIRTTKISHPAFVSTLTLLPSAASLESTARHGVPFNTSLIMVFPILPSPGAPSMTKEGYPQLPPDLFFPYSCNRIHRRLYVRRKRKETKPRQI